HGEYDRMIEVLRNTGVIDDGLRWVGGDRHLVVIGDIFDRGPDATRALWFLYGLQRQAGGPDGRVHVLLGNHETMVMLDDLRYVSDKERAIAVRYGVGYASLFDPRTSILGRWLVSLPALIRLGDLLFVHGGLSSDYARWRIRQVDDSLAAWTHEELFSRWNDTTYVIPLDSAGYVRRWNFFNDPRSMFWYRGYAQSDTTGAELDAVLRAFDAHAMVVGHTTGPHVRERFGGKLIAVNTLPFVIEAALLVRRDDGWDRYRIGVSGPPVPLEPVTLPRPARALEAAYRSTSSGKRR
ncbi:MAG: metallophosphoesterase, partial [Gemmatimonadota bacterium]